MRVHRNSTFPILPTACAYGAAFRSPCYRNGPGRPALLSVRRQARIETGLDVLGGAALLLLLVNIRNAWDLMISLARRTAELTRSGNGGTPNQPPSP